MTTWNYHNRIVNDDEANAEEVLASTNWLRAKSQEIATFLIMDDLFIFSRRDKLHAHVRIPGRIMLEVLTAVLG